ncbi:MAG: hypothetical protein QM764_02075 [Chitinophagaceae bacterium]
MQQATYYLDKILMFLNEKAKGLDNVYGEFNADNILNDIPQQQFRGAYFSELIQILVEDKYIRVPFEGDFPIPFTPEEYNLHTHITMRGILFYENGGYTRDLNAKQAREIKQLKRERKTSENEEKLATWTKRLVISTWAVALGSLALVAWEVIHYFLEIHKR